MRLLLQAAPAAAMVAPAVGWLPLHCAANRGHAAVVRLLVQAGPAAATATTLDGQTPLQLALLNGHMAAARALLGAGPASSVLTALAAAGDPALPLFPDFLLTDGRLPLAAPDWALVPSPCPGLGRVLPAVLDCSPDQAAHLLQRLPAAERARLRTAALCRAAAACQATWPPMCWREWWWPEHRCHPQCTSLPFVIPIPPEPPAATAGAAQHRCGTRLLVVQGRVRFAQGRQAATQVLWV